MFKNFIIITLRSLSNQRLYTFINILGLAVGMACALLISIYLVHEVSYDNFQKDGDRIYRVSVIGKLRGQPLRIAVTPAPLAETFQKENDQVESTVRVLRMGAWLVSNGETRYNEDQLFFTDANFFNFFSYSLIQGNPDSVLSKPRNLVITRTAALKYFGREDVVGEKLKVESFKENFTITGVAEDVPSNSHFHFDILGSIHSLDKYVQSAWISNNVYTYLKIKPGISVKEVEKGLDLMVSKYVVPELNDYFESDDYSQNDVNVINYELQELRKIHLTSNLDVEVEQNGQALYIYTFAIIALLILIVASINFINLSTANSANRAREVVLRKVVGSERKMIIFQFLTESVIFSFSALILALLLSELIMPHFNRYLGLELKFSYLNNLFSIGVIFLFTLLMGLLAGIYPAFFISSYDPVKVLHGILNIGVRSRKVRSVFVVMQFFISILIIILTLVVFAQVKYMVGKELGYNKDRILIIRRPDALKKQINDFKAEVVTNPNIEAISNSNSIPGRNFIVSAFMVQKDSGRQNVLMNQIFVSHEFLKTYGIQLEEGRFFSPDSLTDKNACVINETAAQKIGKDNIIGTYIDAPSRKDKKGEGLKVIGVVRDFNFEPVDKAIDPLVISLMPGNWEGYFNVRLKNRRVEKSIDFLEKTWKKYTTEYPFLYFFLDEDFNRNYTSFVRTGKILLIFSLLSIFVACLGLFGLVLFTSNQRTREIGIRKSLGATYYQVILLLLKETFFLIVYASLLAWVTAWFLAKFWLSEFYVRITLSPKYFIVSTLIVLLLSMLVVLYQSYIASRTEPALALKAE